MTPTNPAQPAITLVKTEDYRDTYANSVQIRLSVWDFHLVFGTFHQDVPDAVTIENFQGVYLSPQQAKALHNVLAHNITQYEQTFGPISLDNTHAEVQRYVIPGNGPVH
jgi:flagellar protein FlaG